MRSGHTFDRLSTLGPARYLGGHGPANGLFPELQRSALTRRITGLTERWIEIVGAPGMGRSTLLDQLAGTLIEEQEWIHAMWTAAHVQAAYEFTGHARRSDLRPIARWLRARAASSATGRVTLLIDDYDSNLRDEHRRALDGLLVAVPQLRVISVSLDEVGLAASFTARNSERVATVSSQELVFSADETQQLAASVAQSYSIQIHSTAPSTIDQATLRLIYDTTKGVPLAVVSALDAVFSANLDPADDDGPGSHLANIMHTLYTDMMHAYLRSKSTRGGSAMHRVLSLMPRFSSNELAACFPDATTDDLLEFAASPALERRSQIKAGEYVWSDEFWSAADALGRGRVSERRDLAMTLYRANHVGGAFEQWFIAGDLARAEAMLRTRFLTVYETLSPETADAVRAIAPAQLAAFPMIRVLQIVLDPRATAAELRQCVENLAILGARGGPTGLLALAVRASVLARNKLGRRTHEQAERVLLEAAGLMQDDSEDTEAERRTVVEAVLTATLALFEIGPIPTNLAVLPHVHGSPFLRHRRELMQQFLDAIRAVPVEGAARSGRALPYSYRALVFSGARCIHGVDELAAFDEAYLGALSGAEQPAQPIRLSVSACIALQGHLTVSEECMRLLMIGDEAGATEVAFRNDLLEPQSSLLKSIVLLASGREREARSVLDGMPEGLTPRFEAIRVVLRAATLAKSGNPEAARATLSDANHLPDAVVVHAFGLLSEEAADELAALQPRYSAHVHAASRVGVLGTSRPLADNRKFKPLTVKERTVLLGLRNGLNTREIADLHFLSVNTVRTHVRSIGKKLDASGQAEMLRRAEDLKLFVTA